MVGIGRRRHVVKYRLGAPSAGADRLELLDA